MVGSLEHIVKAADTSMPSPPESAASVPTRPAAEQAANATTRKASRKPSPKEANKIVAKKTPKAATAAKQINKSEEIRKLARELQAKGEKVRPVTIVETLKKRGIKIAPPQASMVLKSMGFRRRSRSASRGVAAESRKTSGSTLSVADLVKAKKAVEAFGGAKKLIDAVSALVELQ